MDVDLGQISAKVLQLKSNGINFLGDIVVGASPLGIHGAKISTKLRLHFSHLSTQLTNLFLNMSLGLSNSFADFFFESKRNGRRNRRRSRNRSSMLGNHSFGSTGSHGRNGHRRRNLRTNEQRSTTCIATRSGWRGITQNNPRLFVGLARNDIPLPSGQQGSDLLTVSAGWQTINNPCTGGDQGNIFRRKATRVQSLTGLFDVLRSELAYLWSLRTKPRKPSNPGAQLLAGDPLSQTTGVLGGSAPLGIQRRTAMPPVPLLSSKAEALSAAIRSFTVVMLEGTFGITAP